jgi:NAD-dependent deacetylase
VNLGQVAGWLAAAPRIGVLTGAGLSTDSGIPDFRGPAGLWTNAPAAQRQFSIDAYVADRELRIASWARRRDHPAWTARPNDGHRALVDLERSGRLGTIATQNIDGLHQAAGSDPGRVLELHGTIWQALCLSCGDRLPMRAVLLRVDAGEADPGCLCCGGLLKSATVSFGQQLDRAVFAAAREAAEESAVYLAVGSSLTVSPAADLCRIAVQAGARLVVCNGQPTPYDGLAGESGGAVVRGPLSTTLPALIAGALAA